MLPNNLNLGFRDSLLQNSVKEHKLQVLSDLAIDSYNELSKFNVPNMKDDEWRFLDLTSLTAHTFSPSTKELILGENLERLKKLFLPHTIRIILVNGYYAEELSDFCLLNDSLRTSLAVDSRIKSEDDTELSISSDNIKTQNFFTMLNQSFFAEELCLNVVGELAEKIHLLHVNVTNTTKPSAEVSYPRLKIVVNKNCSATLIEEYISFENEASLTNTVTDIIVKNDGRLNHTVLQRLAKTAFYIGHANVTVAKNATYNGNLIFQGGRLSRSDTNIELNAAHAVANLNGLTLINARQTSDVKTVIRHNAPDCQSNQLHKSIIDGGAHSIFNGKIMVAEGAVRTEAHQQNRSLILSKKARVTTEPKLEINNDDVVCTHGATVSQMDEDILFFLKSRGIDQVEATKLCVNAFLHEIISKIPAIEIQNTILATGVN